MNKQKLIAEMAEAIAAEHSGLTGYSTEHSAELAQAAYAVVGSSMEPTDEIRRAYDEWLETDEGVQRGLELNSAYREWMSHAWQAACEYRDKYWQEKVGLLAAECRDALNVAHAYMQPTNTSGVYARQQVERQIQICQQALTQTKGAQDV